VLSSALLLLLVFVLFLKVVISILGIKLIHLLALGNGALMFSQPGLMVLDFPAAFFSFKYWLLESKH
jgi:hypothetical protein